MDSTTPTDRRSDGWSVGRLDCRRSGRRKNSYRGSVRGLREGDAGDTWDRRLVGRLEDRGCKRAEWVMVTLENRTVGRSVGWGNGELDKQID